MIRFRSAWLRGCGHIRGRGQREHLVVGFSQHMRFASCACVSANKACSLHAGSALFLSEDVRSTESRTAETWLPGNVVSTIHRFHCRSFSPETHVLWPACSQYSYQRIKTFQDANSSLLSLPNIMQPLCIINRLVKKEACWTQPEHKTNLWWYHRVKGIHWHCITITRKTVLTSTG